MSNYHDSGVSLLHSCGQQCGYCFSCPERPTALHVSFEISCCFGCTFIASVAVVVLKKGAKDSVHDMHGATPLYHLACSNPLQQPPSDPVTAVLPAAKIPTDVYSFFFRNIPWDKYRACCRAVLLKNKDQIILSEIARIPRFLTSLPGFVYRRGYIHK